MFKALVNRSFRFQTKLHLQRFAFGGGHAKPFDWRDDHTLNPFYEEDPRRAGLPDPYTYGQPYQSPPNPNPSSFSPDYNPKDLTQNYIGSAPLQSVAETNLL